YLCLELLLGVKVAVKEYFPMGISTRQIKSREVRISNEAVNLSGYKKGMEAFQREARTLALFDRPSIVHVREYFIENNTAYIVMDYVDGIGLDKEILRCGGRIPWDRVVNLMTPLMAVLDEVHQKNLIHRDIKPENIKLVTDPKTCEQHLILLDFGAARTSSSNKTVTQIVTPGYAPIEQYQQHTNLGPYTDVYALCATMYTAITGEKPISAPDRMVGEELKPFSDFDVNVPESVEKVILHGLGKNYKDRPQTMRELCREMEQAAAQQNVCEQTVIAGNVPDNTGKGSKTVFWLILFLFCFAGAASYFGVIKPRAAVSNALKTQAVLDAAETMMAEVRLTESAIQTATQQAVLSFTPEPTLTPTSTDTPVPTSTPTIRPTATKTPTPTRTKIPTPTRTKTPSPTVVRLNLRTGDTFTFGRYEQDRNSGADPIRWRVLTVENGRALVMSLYGLEAIRYNRTYTDVTWETSYLREWLNGEFYNTAFSAQEKSMIAEVRNVNQNNPKHGTRGGNDTWDRIFLLSYDEAVRYIDSKDDFWQCEPTDRAEKDASVIDGYSPWWLRTPGEYSDDAVAVNVLGYIFTDGYYVNSTSTLARPAFWIDL
ncbi:MAG: serine/threonine protein kinase, partial [Anaerolineaceae bacterium]|nr:serine/threonine protein kinase [Anaerolineaceae bacterium]